MRKCGLYFNWITSCCGVLALKEQGWKQGDRRKLLWMLLLNTLWKLFEEIKDRWQYSIL